MTVILGLYAFVLGMLLGSFALVLADRMKAGTDWVKGRSECTYCHHGLSAVDLVPVVSWLAQGGKCRYCRKRLSPAYLLIELGLGLAFVGSYVFWPGALTDLSQQVLLALWLASLVLAAALFVYDLRWYLLPNKLVYPLIAFAGVHRAIVIATNDHRLGTDLIAVGLSVAVAAGFFFVLHELSKGKWIGDGDVTLGIAMGLFLPGPFEAWFAICVASVLGVLVAFPKLLRSKKNLKMRLPFGPLLLIGLYVSYFFAGSVLSWYVETFLYLN